MIKKKSWASLSLKIKKEIFRERTEVQKRFLGKNKKKEEHFSLQIFDDKEFFRDR